MNGSKKKYNSHIEKRRIIIVTSEVEKNPVLTTVDIKSKLKMSINLNSPWYRTIKSKDIMKINTDNRLLLNAKALAKTNKYKTKMLVEKVNKVSCANFSLMFFTSFSMIINFSNQYYNTIVFY